MNSQSGRIDCSGSGRGRIPARPGEGLKPLVTAVETSPMSARRINMAPATAVAERAEAVADVITFIRDGLSPTEMARFNREFYSATHSEDRSKVLWVVQSC